MHFTLSLGPRTVSNYRGIIEINNRKDKHMSVRIIARTFLAVSSLLILGSVSFSQGMMMATPEERAKRLTERLSLTEDQTKKVQEIFKNADKERSEKMEPVRGDRDAMREQMTAIMASTDKQIEKILTDEQKKKYEELKKERRQMRGGERGSRRQQAKPDSAKS